jgi:DNA-binding beta-propeller fold protein YncE
MRARSARITLCSALAGLASLVVARVAVGDGWDEEEGFSPPAPFSVFTPSIGGVKPATAAGPALAGSRIAALPDGGALVSDADSGMLIRTDGTGARRDQLEIGADAGLLVYDDNGKRAYVADRHGDRIVVVGIGETLSVVASWKTPAEPYGVALTPDRHTLLVTAIADRVLAAYDIGTNGRERWRAGVDPEPRGVAVAPDGKRALVTSLATGTLAQFSLDERVTARRLALPTAFHAGSRARGAFAVGFVGDMAVTPYQLEIPVASEPTDTGHYGGSFTPPISHQLAWLAPDGRQMLAGTNVHEPRAIAWDGSRDLLYIAGLASDEVVVIKKASQVDVTTAATAGLGQRCGADGLAIAGDGTLLVWCSFTRSVARFAPGKVVGEPAAVAKGPELVASTLDESRHAGLVLFHSANEHISGFGGMSCGNCHLDGRADGLSWRIGSDALQTPVLAGRIADTAPYKWDGGAKDLPASLKATITRLGGSGLSKKDLASLTAFVESMPVPRAPTRELATVARGKALFESAELGCASCHEGRAYTDRDRHAFGTKQAFDTPGLAGLAASAPYFHDGSAATLEEVLRDRGRVHGMADEAKALTPAQLRDLIAFLESL